MNTLKAKNHPSQDGAYIAGNYNKMKSRLEIGAVVVIGTDVFVVGDSEPFIFTDFDFWSDKLKQD